MSKKKKHIEHQNHEPSPKAKAYFMLWVKLNAAHDEPTIDGIRHEMHALWVTMEDGDKTDFHLIPKHKRFTEQ